MAKITIELDTTVQGDKDIFDRLTKKEVVPTPHAPMETKTVVTFPKIRGQGKETVRKIIDMLELASREEISKHTDLSKTSIDNYIYMLRQEGIIEGTVARDPRQYFIKKKGNPELKTMIPSGTKVEVHQ